MSKTITYKDYHNITITIRVIPTIYHMSLLESIMRSNHINTIMLRLASDGHVSAFEKGKGFLIFVYDNFSEFLKDWNILNRRMLIEKTGHML